jgi:hypothetical protein
MPFIERPIGSTGFSNAHGVDRTFSMTLPENPEAASMVSLDYIHALAREGREDPVVRRKAFEIVRRAGVTDGRQTSRIIAAIHRWIQKHVFYMHDPSGVEMLTQARVLIEQAERGEAVEDCDTFVLIEHALLNSVGVPTRSVIWKADARAPDQWSHITLEAFDNKRGTWVPLDPIMKDKPIGWAPPKYYGKRVVPVGDGPPFPGRERAPQVTRLRTGKAPAQSFKGFFGGGSVNQVTWRGFGRYGDERADIEHIMSKTSASARIAHPECHDLAGAPSVWRQHMQNEGAKELTAAGIRPQNMDASNWMGHINGIFFQQVGAQWPYHDWPPKDVQKAKGLLDNAASYLTRYPEPAPSIAARWKQAGIDLVKCHELRRAESNALIPYYELGRVFGEIKHFKQMRDELATYIPKLMESIAPLAERGERFVDRIETKQERLELVGEVAKWTSLVLSALGPITGGITEILAIAVTLGNLAYQYDRAAAMATGSSAKTLQAVAGGFKAIESYVEAISSVMESIEGEITQRYALIEVLREAHPEYFAPQTPAQEAALTAGEGEPKRNLMPVLAVGGVAAAVLLMAVL